MADTVLNYFLQGLAFFGISFHSSNAHLQLKDINLYLFF